MRVQHLVAGLLLVAGLSACKKERMCECILSNSDGDVLDVRTFVIKDTKKKAAEACDQLTGTQDEAGNTWTCQLKE